MINQQLTSAMNREDILAKAPAVLSEDTAGNVSKHYTHIPTTELISDMEKLGWYVTDVDQQQSRKGVRVLHGKHMVIFRNKDIKMTDSSGDTVYPQILITNSHDGTAAFRFNAGLFRVVCANGLVVSSENFGSLRIKHRAYTFQELQTAVMKMVEELPATVEVLNKFKAIELTEEQKLEFALESLGIRFAGAEAEVEPKLLLEPKRGADKGNSLWAVYNVVQEQIIQGGFAYKTSSGRNKTAKPVTAFQRNIKMNQELFTLAESYV
jgi:hypothetical protein